MVEISELTITGLSTAFERGDVTPVDVLESTLERAEKAQIDFNAFVHFDPEGARQAAEASAARWRVGEQLGVLDGVPVPLKDSHAVRGWPTPRFGSRILDGSPPSEDAPIVAVLRSAGAVFFARTLACEFGWKALGDSPLNGAARNPWNPDHTPGGSSAGSAVAVAAGVARVAQGGDGGGSIRIPASFCGIFGLKPTAHRVSSSPSPLGSLPVQGVLTPTAAETAAVFDILTRPHPRDTQQLPFTSIGRPSASAEGLRVGLSVSLGFPGIDPEVRMAVLRAADILANAGAEIVPCELDFTSARQTLDTIWATGMRSVVGGVTASQRELMDPGLLEMLDSADRLTAMDLQRALDDQRRLSRQLGEVEQEFDLVLSATALTLPPLVGHDVPEGGPFRSWLDWAGPAWLCNLTRRPAANVPVSISEAGLPIGVQLMGPILSERRILAASMALEERTDRTEVPVSSRNGRR